jgi:hypothetical protein
MRLSPAFAPDSRVAVEFHPTALDDIFEAGTGASPDDGEPRRFAVRGFPYLLVYSVVDKADRLSSTSTR